MLSNYKKSIQLMLSLKNDICTVTYKQTCYIFSYDIVCPQSEQVLVQVSVSEQQVSPTNTCSCDLDADKGKLERTAFLKPGEFRETVNIQIYCVMFYFFVKIVLSRLTLYLICIFLFSLLLSGISLSLSLPLQSLLSTPHLVRSCLNLQMKEVRDDCIGVTLPVKQHLIQSSQYTIIITAWRAIFLFSFQYNLHIKAILETK